MNAKMSFQIDYTQCNTNRGMAPSISTFRGKIHCFYQGAGGRRLMHMRTSNGLYWESANAVNIGGATTSAGPCSVVYQDQLHVFYRDGNGDAIFHICSSDGDNWSKPYNIGRDTRSNLSAAVLGDALVIAYRNPEGNGIMRSKLRGGKWSHGNTLHTTSERRPGIVAFNGLYHLFYRDGGVDGKGVMHASSKDGESWYGHQPFHVLNTETSGSPTAVIYGGKMHLFYRDNGGNAIYHVFSGDGSNFEFAEPLNIGLDLDDGASAAVLDDMLCLVGVDAHGSGIMRAVHFPPIKSPLKGWDYIAAVDLGAIKAPAHLTAFREAKLPDTLQAHFLDVRLESGVVAAPDHEKDVPVVVSFPVSAQVRAEQTREAGANTTSARLIVAPSIRAIPSTDKAGRWDVMLDFGKLAAPPRLEDMDGDPIAMAPLLEAFASQIESLPALLLASIEPPFGSGEQPFNYYEFLSVKDPNRPKGILLALLSTKGKAPDEPDCRTFTPSVLPEGSDVALYACNEQVIRYFGGRVQALVREKMGKQGRDGTRDLTYEYKAVPGEPQRLRAYTEGDYCRFWNREYTPSVDWSWVDAAHSRLTVFLRLRAAPALDIAVYVEAMPSLMMQIGSNPSKIAFQVEKPIPKRHVQHGVFGPCAEKDAENGAAQLASELGDALSGIKPIDIGNIAEFTKLSINQLGELFIAARIK